MPASALTVELLVANESFQNWVLQANDSDVALWDSWLVANPHQRPVVEEAAQLVQLLNTANNPQVSVARQARALERLQGQLASYQPTHVNGRLARVKRLYHQWRQLAAVVALLVLAGLSGWWYLSSGPTQLQTGFGESQSVRLPDGSLVTLNANSRLTIPEDWSQDSLRQVWLEGEAFFQVVKQASVRSLGYTKFVVHTPDVAVEVLGTQFNVNTRRGKTVVALQEGKVRLRGAGKGLVELVPGEMAEYSSAGRQGLRRQRVDIDHYISWREQRMLFEQTSLGEIAQLLEDTQGLVVVFQDSTLAQLRFTGNYQTTQTDHFLQVLGRSFDLAFTRQQDTIIVTRK